MLGHEIPIQERQRQFVTCIEQIPLLGGETVAFSQGMTEHNNNQLNILALSHKP
jgi:hypothetical protein